MPKVQKKCPHNRQRCRCRDCGGSSICEHKKIKTQCRECGGSTFCEHNKRRAECRDCGGSAICEHDKLRRQCRECGGSSICEHNKFRKDCRKCGGSAICEHNKQRATCRKCGGSSICEHNKQRNHCRECGGSSFCVHNKFRFDCIDCTPANACTNCLHNLKHRRYKPLCYECHARSHPGMRMKRCRVTREIYMTRVLMKSFPDTVMVFDKIIEGGCSKRRPDVFMDLLTHVVIVECDEKQHKHKSYIAQCERRRKMELFQDVGNRPVVFVRFNPDRYNGKGGCFREDMNKNGEIVLTPLPEWKVRTRQLISTVGHHMVTIPVKELTETCLFFD